jgi:hypothetical protein
MVTISGQGVEKATVYVVGYASIGGINIAKLWKGNSSANLTDGTHDASANSVYVSPTSEYFVAGYQYSLCN